MFRPHPRSPLFPYTTLFRSCVTEPCWLAGMRWADAPPTLGVARSRVSSTREGDRPVIIAPGIWRLTLAWGGRHSPTLPLTGRIGQRHSITSPVRTACHTIRPPLLEHL